jgi:hypothetical protein
MFRVLRTVIALALQAADGGHGELVMIPGHGVERPLRRRGSGREPANRASKDACCQQAVCVLSVHLTLAFSLSYRVQGEVPAWLEWIGGACSRRIPSIGAPAPAVSTTKCGERRSRIVRRVAAGIIAGGGASV